MTEEPLPPKEEPIIEQKPVEVVPEAVAAPTPEHPKPPRRKLPTMKAPDKQPEVTDEWWRDLASAALQEGTGAFEYFLVQQLSLASSAEPLRKIELLSEACQMCPEDIQQKIGIDANEVRILQRVSVALQKASEKNQDVVSIPWGVHESLASFERYIMPWINDYDYIETGAGGVYDWRTLFTSTRAVTRQGLSNIQTSFIHYGMPKAMMLYFKLCKLINPNTYEKAVRAAAGGRR